MVLYCTWVQVVKDVGRVIVADVGEVRIVNRVDSVRMKRGAVG